MKFKNILKKKIGKKNPVKNLESDFVENYKFLKNSVNSVNSVIPLKI